MPPYPIHARPSKDPSRLDSPASEGFSHKKAKFEACSCPLQVDSGSFPKPPLPTPTYFPNAHSLYLSPLSTRLRIMHSSKTGPSVTSPALGVPHTRALGLVFQEPGARRKEAASCTSESQANCMQPSTRHAHNKLCFKSLKSS